MGRYLVRKFARMLPVAPIATIPGTSFAGDAHCHDLTDDFVEGGRTAHVNGAIAGPTGPGLGVTLDEDRMRNDEKFHETKGDYDARCHQAPYRPDWHPVVVGM